MAHKKTKITAAMCALYAALVMANITGGWAMHNSRVALERATMALERTEASNVAPSTVLTGTAYSVEKFNATTAAGYKPKPGLHVAVSKDRLDLLGKRVYITLNDGTSLGIREVSDVMHGKHTNAMDLMVSTTKEAKAFGTKDLNIYILK